MGKLISRRFRAAAELLAQPRGFMKATFAADAQGHEVHWADPRATSFCMVGALRRAAKADGVKDYARTVDGLRPYGLASDAHGGLVYINDAEDTTQDDVVTFLLLAAEAEKTR